MLKYKDTVVQFKIKLFINSIILAIFTLTIWWKLLPLKNGNTEDILIEVSNVKLTIETPLGVDSVIDGSGSVTLRAHGHFTVWITLS